MSDQRVSEYVANAGLSWPLRLAARTDMFIGLALVQTALRILFLLAEPVPLGFDEAQYWSWTQEPAWGYFSKPPLLTFLMQLSTGLFQTDAAWAIRIISPVLILGSALLVRAATAHLSDTRTANIAGTLFLLMPAASVGSLFATTDVPLIFFWAAALYALIRARENDGAVLIWFALAGLFTGLAALSKYTGLAFYLPFFLAILFDRKTRKAALPFAFIAAPLFTLLAFSPHLLWSIDQGFITAQHVADDANYSGLRFDIQDFSEFFGAQFGVFGPLMMIAFIIMTFRRSGRGMPDGMFLLLMAWSWLAVMMVQAALGGAEVNWAMPAYIAATIAVVLYCMRGAFLWPLTWSLGLSALLVPVFISGTLVSGNFHAENRRIFDPFARLRHGPEFGSLVAAEFEKLNDPVLLAESRKDIAELIYHAAIPISKAYHWNPDRDRDNHYEMARDLEEAKDRTILFVSFFPDLRGREKHFLEVEPLCRISLRTHKNRSFVRYIYRLEEFSGYAQAPNSHDSVPVNRDTKTCILKIFDSE